jgi:hypothetical protein
MAFAAATRGGNSNWHRGMPSPNKGGKPKSVAEVVALARQNSVEASHKLLEVGRKAKSPATQLAAANAILDRGLGKRFQAVAVADFTPTDVDIDPSMDPVAAAAAWARMIGSDTPHQLARLIDRQPAEDNLTQRLQAASLQIKMRSRSLRTRWKLRPSLRWRGHEKGRAQRVAQCRAPQSTALACATPAAHCASGTKCQPTDRRRT